MKIPETSTRKNVYAPWKPVHQKERILSLKRGELISPTHVQVDLTGACIHNCLMCFYRNAGFTHLEFVPKELIPVEVGVTLFDQMADLGVPALELTGGGEPLCYPEIDTCLDRIAKRDLELALVTNGVLLTEKVLDRIVNPKWIRVSVDSATPETHKVVHRVPNQFWTVVRNIERVVEKNYRGCELGVSYIIQPENVHEIVKATRMFKKIGVDNIRFSYAFTSKLSGLLSKDERKTVDSSLREARKMEGEGFRVFVMDTRLDDFSGKNDTFMYCGYQMFTFVIGCDSLVYPCCILKYHKKSAIGDVRKQTLCEIVFGRERRRQIKEFNVKQCLPCWLRHRNEFIEYLLVDNPSHVNFV